MQALLLRCSCIVGLVAQLLRRWGAWLHAAGAVSFHLQTVFLFKQESDMRGKPTLSMQYTTGSLKPCC
jgi:hypothetical protein